MCLEGVHAFSGDGCGDHSTGAKFSLASLTFYFGTRMIHMNVPASRIEHSDSCQGDTSHIIIMGFPNLYDLYSSSGAQEVDCKASYSSNGS